MSDGVGRHVQFVVGDHKHPFDKLLMCRIALDLTVSSCVREPVSHSWAAVRTHRVRDAEGGQSTMSTAIGAQFVPWWREPDDPLPDGGEQLHAA